MKPEGVTRSLSFKLLLEASETKMLVRVPVETLFVQEAANNRKNEKAGRNATFLFIVKSCYEKLLFFIILNLRKYLPVSWNHV